jgi:hypothetical protein
LGEGTNNQIRNWSLSARELINSQKPWKWWVLNNFLIFPAKFTPKWQMVTKMVNWLG